MDDRIPAALRRMRAVLAARGVSIEQVQRISMLSPDWPTLLEDIATSIEMEKLNVESRTKD